MICDKDRMKINKILREIKTLENRLLILCAFDIVDDCSFISELNLCILIQNMKNIMRQMQDLKDQLARLYAINA